MADHIDCIFRPQQARFATASFFMESLRLASGRYCWCWNWFVPFVETLSKEILIALISKELNIKFKDHFSKGVFLIDASHVAGPASSKVMGQGLHFARLSSSSWGFLPRALNAFAGDSSSVLDLHHRRQGLARLDMCSLQIVTIICLSSWHFVPLALEASLISCR